MKRQKLTLNRIRGLNNLWLTDQKDIANEAVLPFQSQLNGDAMTCDEELLERIPSIIEEAQREALEAPPTLEEIHDIIKSLSEESTTGPDGFNGNFYNYCWDIIKHDLFDAVT